MLMLATTYCTSNNTCVMSSFPAEKEDRLMAARTEFQLAMMENELFSSLLIRSIEEWDKPASSTIKVLMQPSVMPQQGAEVEQVIAGGVQVGFKSMGTQFGASRWHFLDLALYDPRKLGYRRAEPLLQMNPTASDEETMQLITDWGGAITRILNQFGPYDLRANVYTGEIDLRENIEEGRMPVHLPRGDLEV